MKTFAYIKLKENDSERLADEFCRKHGDSPNGIISDAEYDRLFDHVYSVLRKYGSFAEDSGDADFSSSRYVDQVPWITIVADDRVKLSIALSAGLEAVSTAHRPLTVAFDYYPEELFVMAPAKVFSTFSERKLNET